MKILIDAFGGDHAPLEVLRGARLAADELGICPVLCGDEARVRECASQNGISLEGMELVHAGEAIPVEAEPTGILGEYSGCSMAAGLRLLAEGGADAFVTGGSTGAMVVGTTMLVKRIKGIKRPALATMLPDAASGHLLLDMGANAECRPEMLLQFGVMGSIYMEQVMGVKSPRVGLVNIGAEDNKGLELHIRAGELLRKAPVNFIGNVEARGIPLGECDVAVADGFVGNVMLKHTEGLAKFFTGELKRLMLGSTGAKLGALMLKGGLKEFRKKLDYTEYGGAPLLGIARPVIKAHGSSDANAFKNALRQARMVCDKQVVEKIAASLAQLRQQEAEGSQV